MLTEEFKQKTLQDLKEQKYSAFEAEELSVAFKAEVREWLKSEGIYIFDFYRHRRNKTRYFIAFQEAEINEKRFRIYSENQNAIGKILPFACAMSILLLTVIFMQYGFMSLFGHGVMKSLMNASVVILIPFFIGMLFEYLASLNEPNLSFWRASKNAVFGSIFILVVSVLVLREGVICLVMLGPLAFAALFAGSGVMQLICVYFWKPTNKIYSLSILPLLLYLVLPDFSRHEYGQTQREMIIHASPEQVFKAINQIGPIQANEVPNSFIFTMGFPKPIFGMTEQRAEGMVRTIQWERGVQFEERVKAIHPPYLLSWDYQFNPNSFPKGSLDDHVEVGGQYFDLLKTDYQLAKIDAHTTKLVLTIDYRVSTEFNWYSKLWIHYVLGEFSDVVMTIHKNRLE
jgi:hypothetical protein